MRNTNLSSYNDSPLFTRCHNWMSQETNIHYMNGFNSSQAAVSFCHRVTKRIQRLDLNEPIEAALPNSFTTKEREAGLNEEEHLEQLQIIALEYFEMLDLVENLVRRFKQG